METFFLSLTVLFAGGLYSLLSHRQFSLMKGGYIAITVTGCLIGLYAIMPIIQDGLTLTQSWKWLHLFDLGFSLDSLSAFFLIPVLGICPLAVLYSFHYMDKPQHHRRTGVNFFFFNLLIISMALVAVADNMISFALAWELMSISSFFLVMHEYQQEATRKAGYIYLIFTQAGAMFVFAAMGVGYGYSGSFSFASLGGIPETVKIAVFLLALVGFGSKAGVFPLHIWLPHAHPAAPSHISAVMSGVMIKMGIYGIIRFYSMLEVTDVLLGQVVLACGMISGILGVVYALGKHDLKKLLAYHSVENIGIILIGVGVGMIGITTGNTVMAVFGFTGGLLHVLNHSIFKSLLFLGAGAVVQQTGTRHVDQLGGLLKRMPITGKTFLVGSISISGLPPFNGFVSEFLIYYGAFHGLTLGGASFIFIMLAILSLALIGGLAAACFSKVVGVVFLGEPRTDHCAEAREARSAITLSMIILALACLVIGLFPEPFVQTALAGLKNIRVFQGIGGGELTAVTAKLAFSARLCLVVFIFCVLLRKIFYRGKVTSRKPTWGCGFTQPTVRMQYTGTSYAMSIMEFFNPFVLIRTGYSNIKRIFPGQTTYTTRVDDIAEIAINDRIVSPMLYFLGKMRWIQHGHIQLYIAYIIVTIIVLLLFV